MDCSKTENYFKERARMTKTDTNYHCKIDCSNCSLGSDNNGTGFGCTKLEMLYPQKAIEIVQRWSDENPQKTYLSEFLKCFPNAKLDNDGTPFDICVNNLGICQECKGNCKECWNIPITENY